MWLKAEKIWCIIETESRLQYLKADGNEFNQHRNASNTSSNLQTAINAGWILIKTSTVIEELCLITHHAGEIHRSQIQKRLILALGAQGDRWTVRLDGLFEGRGAAFRGHICHHIYHSCCIPNVIGRPAQNDRRQERWSVCSANETCPLRRQSLLGVPDMHLRSNPKCLA